MVTAIHSQKSSEERAFPLEHKPAKAVNDIERKGENAMKTLISIFAVTLALAFTGPAFAGDVTAAKTEADCAKAGGTWNATTKVCEEKKM
jgi:hypothetical protein